MYNPAFPESRTDQHGCEKALDDQGVNPPFLEEEQDLHQEAFALAHPEGNAGRTLGPRQACGSSSRKQVQAENWWDVYDEKAGDDDAKRWYHAQVIGQAE